MDSAPDSVFKPVEEGSTPDLILKAAGRLFAAKGFHGTSTREIALAVGIRQPSLFHHFASKTAIAQHLLEYDRQRSPLLSQRLELLDAPPAVCLYQGLRHEAVVVLTSRYELQGLYLTEALFEPEFQYWKGEYDRGLATVRGVVAAGIDGGDFVEQDAALVTVMFDAMLTRMVRWSSVREHDAKPDEIATLLLRAILRRPETLDAIREAADTALGGRWPPGLEP